MIDVGDLLDRTTIRGPEVVAGEVRDRDEARLHEAVGYAEQCGGLGAAIEVHGGEHGAEAAAAQARA